MAQIVELPTAPVSGTNEVQQIASTGVVTAGRFKLGYKYDVTDWLNWNDTATEIRDALRLLNEITATGIASASGGALPATPVVLNFGGHLAAADVALLSLASDELVGGSLAISVTTPGVTATRRGLGTGVVVVAKDTGILYTNTGTANAPVWKRINIGAAAAAPDLVHAFGTAEGTLVDVGGAFSQATLNDNFKELSSKLNTVLAALRNSGAILP